MCKDENFLHSFQLKFTKAFKFRRVFRSYHFLFDCRCDNDINECVTLSPCQHDGVCVNLPGLFRCECPDQFTGEFCESFRQITCKNEPCKNDATCTDVPNPKTGDNFTCTCMPGYEGPICDTPYCIGRKCQNGGRCDFLYQVIRSLL